MSNLSKVILGTGNYYDVKSGNTVSVTGDGGNAWGYFGPAYKKLAPKLVTYTPYAEKLEELEKLKEDVSKLKEYVEFRKQIEDEYIKSYYDIRLKDLDVKELLYILNEKFGNDIILLCHVYQLLNQFTVGLSGQKLSRILKAYQNLMDAKRQSNGYIEQLNGF